MSLRIVTNPDFTGPPRIIEPICHDLTPFLTVRCSCGDDSHVHESQTSHLDDDAVVVARCRACGRQSSVHGRFFREAFAAMRAQGWIA